MNFANPPQYSMGTGRRSFSAIRDRSSRRLVPAPGYSQPKDKKKKFIGGSIPKSQRERNYQNVSNNSLPAPNQYINVNPHMTIGKTGQKFHFAGKKPLINPLKDNPGPGQYE